MIIGVKSNPVYSQPELFEGAQAAAKSINDSGGVAGHPLDLEECNDNLDPNQEKACLAKAVSDNVSAVVGSFFNFGDFSDIEKAKIPMVLNQGIATTEYTSPMSFTMGANVTWFESLGGYVAGEGAKSVSIGSIGTGSGDFSATLMTNSATRAKLTITGKVSYDPTTTDYSSYAATLTEGNPEAIMLSGTAEGIVPLIRSIWST